MMIAIGLLLAQSACSFAPLVRRASLDYNEIIEDSQNQVFLLNVIRASQRRPRYYSNFNKVTGQVTGSVGLSMDAQRSPYTVKPSLSISGGTGAFDVAPLDTQEFIRGIMTAASAETFWYFWDQGWSREMLLYLFVRKIELFDVVEKNGEKRPIVRYSWENYPADYCQFDKFQTEAKILAGCKLVRDTVRDTVVPLVRKDDAQSFLKASEQKLALESVGATYRLTKSRSVYRFDCTPSALEASSSAPSLDQSLVPEYFALQRELSGRTSVAPDGGRAGQAEKAVPTGEQSGALVAWLEQADVEAGKKGRTGGVVLTLRSPEAMIEYLGELARETQDIEPGALCSGRSFLAKSVSPNAACPEEAFHLPTVETRTKGSPRPWPLFVVSRERARFSRSRTVSVTYDGVSYGIPKDTVCASRSMHAIALISQLLGLHKSSKDLPAQETLTVLGL